jgi:hypothetical protein
MNNCPHCGVILIGDPIPEELNKPYTYQGKTYKPYGDSTHWRREIGIEYPEKYDGVWEWMCPDCKGVWPSAVGRLKRD